MAVTEYVGYDDRRVTRRGLNVLLILLGPVATVALFLLGVALVSGIPPAASPHREAWADGVIVALMLGIPLGVGIAMSARGVAGIRKLGGWATIALAVTTVLIGVALIGLALWRIGWPVLVTGWAT